MVCVDQKDLQSPRLQDLKERDPVHSCRFHRHRLNVAGFQPVCSGVQVFGECREMANRLRIAIRRHGDVDLGGPYIYAGGIRVKAVQDRCTGLLAAPSFSGHGSPLSGFAMRVSAQTVRKEYSSDRDRRTQYGAAVTTDLSTESGTILLNGLLKDAPLCFRPTCRHAWTRLCYRTTT